jgi:hypothetical protein
LGKDSFVKGDSMVRKILAGILIVISSILLGLSIAGVTLVWMYKQPLTGFNGPVTVNR